VSPEVVAFRLRIRRATWLYRAAARLPLVADILTRLETAEGPPRACLELLLRSALTREGLCPECGHVRDSADAPTCRHCALEARTARMVPCYGAAHSNAHIDHCGVCLNHEWGWIPAREGER
jgi:hypothetical protein